MADQLISQLTESENLQDDDLFVIWKGNIQQTRSIRKRNLGISGSAGGNPDRCIVFDFADSNHKSILIKKGTSFTINYQGIDYVKTWETDTRINLASAITLAAAIATVRTNQENGRVFQIFLTTSGDIVLSTRLDAPSDIDETYTTQNTLWLGYFSTLCVAVPSDQTSTLAVTKNGYAVGNSVNVKGGYYKNDPYGFYSFYSKIITAISTSAYFDTATVPHVLAGFGAGQILPESVFCLGFMPKAGNMGNEGAQGMVYDPDTEKAVDIYLQSGNGQGTISEYGTSITSNRHVQNHIYDLSCVRKTLLSYEEFSSCAKGANEKTNIVGSTLVSTTGGHNDTAGKRMISFIGCEDTCGLLWQLGRTIASGGGSGWTTTYGRNDFGQTEGTVYEERFGGGYNTGVSNGSRAIAGDDLINHLGQATGARGCCEIIRK